MDVTAGGNSIHAPPMFIARDDLTIRTLIECKASVNQRMPNMSTPIYNAVAQGWINTINVLTAAKADPNEIVSDTGMSLIHVAAQKGSLDVIQTLIRVNGDVNRVTNDGRTALMMASDGDNVALVTALMDISAS